MAKHAGLPWDCIFCADIVRHFKPDPEVYRGVIEFLALSPHETMLVAAHNDDHRHARSHGMRTAYVNRPSALGRASAWSRLCRSKRSDALYARARTKRDPHGGDRHDSSDGRCLEIALTRKPTNARFWHKADMSITLSDVRFWG
jgi:beta-phosphoglucomutase-like phosphatase (HAD superfamily)